MKKNKTDFIRTMPKQTVDMMWRIIGDQPIDAVMKMLFVISGHPHCNRILHRMIERNINGRLMVESVMNDHNGDLQAFILNLLHSNPIIKGRILL